MGPAWGELDGPEETWRGQPGVASPRHWAILMAVIPQEKFRVPRAGALSTPHTKHHLPTDAKLTPVQFGNLQKLDGPTEQCQDPPPSLASNCTDRVSPWPLLPAGHGDSQEGGPGFPGWVLRCPGERGSPSPWVAEDRPPLWRHTLSPTPLH